MIRADGPAFAVFAKGDSTRLQLQVYSRSCVTWKGSWPVKNWELNARAKKWRTSRPRTSVFIVSSYFGACLRRIQGCKERKHGHPARMVRPPVRFLFVPNWDKNSNFLRSVVTKTGDPLRIESHRLAVVEGVASGYWPPPAKRSSGLVSH